jgi:bacteriocin-like protein
MDKRDDLFDLKHRKEGKNVMQIKRMPNRHTRQERGSQQNFSSGKQITHVTRPFSVIELTDAELATISGGQGSPPPIISDSAHLGWIDTDISVDHDIHQGESINGTNPVPGL